MTSSKFAFVIHPEFKQFRHGTNGNLRNADAKLEEAVGLTVALELTIADAWVQPVSEPKPATLFGDGTVESVAGKVAAQNVGLVIVNTGMSPVQQRNLETRWKCKVIDRTALILEIFGERAQTREGKLQVELASLNYQKSRLVRSWTHLERQRGGFGFLGGPGESQIETDRRLIRDRIAKIRKELEQVTRTRTLHRAPRREVPYPMVALVGYTNAGKSSLFNRLTRAEVLADDRLFATLDPTIRSLRLPSGFTVMLSDTVGFVSDLPTDLIAAFRATLEEVLEADILLHVRDISHPDTEAQKEDVLNVLSNLFGGEVPEEKMIEVLNKTDKLQQDIKDALHEKGTMAVSALTGDGVDTLLKRIDEKLDKEHHVTQTYALPVSDGKSIAWLHAHGHIVNQEQNDEILHLTVRLSAEDAARFGKNL